ncbi:HEPN domain-containing protein [Reyranella sp. CPCC 100927]|uniref:HEPN domain-containing protein n=1 Tax=Reyranella sp. CPCC 100927 TaxID=2599616 RepID=UPI0011B36C6B|nr:HEPN domain-containing protein [Reyranella sp. CPCC 100927]TWT02115.1 HEPN domain-containing protein [Reyranella sp. CPCC 100927]
MRPEAARRLAKAERFLHQATILDETVMTETVIHGAYYAMFHAAAAVLLERTGKAPKTHAAMVGQFSGIARTAGKDAELLARRFNRAESRRLIADYDDVPAEEDDAASVRASAIEFLALCRRLLGV